MGLLEPFVQGIVHFHKEFGEDISYAYNCRNEPPSEILHPTT